MQKKEEAGSAVLSPLENDSVTQISDGHVYCRSVNRLVPGFRGSSLGGGLSSAETRDKLQSVARHRIKRLASMVCTEQ